MLRKVAAGVLINALVLSPTVLFAQEAPPSPAQQEPVSPQGQEAPQVALLSAQEMEQLVAPIALYPDALLAQIMMASTYPLEVVSAARWSKANPKIQGKDLESEMQKQTWDASVKSLVAFPQVLQMMNEKLDWTEKLGDAFLAQQKDMMDAVQRLRAKAHTQGTLVSSKEQTVKVDNSNPSTQVIVIEPAQPDVVYVPTYNPTVVYGAWPYPAYPPYTYYPPGYVAATNVLSFGLGIAAGYALWGDYDWHGGNVNVNVNNYTRFNHVSPPPGWHGAGEQWQHNPVHRRGVPYNNANVERQFRGNTNFANQAHAREQAREAFRGRTAGGGSLRPDGIRPDGIRPDGNRLGGGGAGERRSPGEHRLGVGGAGERHTLGQGNGAAFQGLDRGRGAQVDSLRGAGSRQVMRSHPSGGGFNGSKGGGGGFHGGGGIHRR